jgi:hypothetical protein
MIWQARSTDDNNLIHVRCIVVHTCTCYSDVPNNNHGE